ncbi:hypothetical protein D3C81_1240640 [compost metagenome]
MRVDVVATGDNRQVLRLNLGVDLCAAGDDLEAVDVGCIKARALDGHRALIHLKAIQTTVVEHWFAGGQGHPWRVDETAAITGDAIRVGNDHPRRLPRHFGVAAQLARIAADDFVENRLRRTAVLQVRVVDDVPAQLRQIILRRAVVEDQPLRTDVVVVELVVRQAAGIGRGDIDDRHAVAGAIQRGIRVGHHNAVGLRPHWLPEHHVRQQKCQAALGHAQKTFTVFHDRRRLERRKGVLANIHVEGLLERAAIVGLKASAMLPERHEP